VALAGTPRGSPSNDRDTPSRDKPDRGAAPDVTLLKAIDPTKLMFAAVPTMEWAVQDWLPIGYTTLSYGDGGVGKTLIAQQLMTSCATGKPWCGLAVMRCKTFGFFCEDDADELHRRQDRINSALGLNFDDLADMRWASGVGEDNRLITFLADGAPCLTPRYYDLTRQAKEFGARVVIVDTAADTFGGNENVRSEVRQFIGHALNRLARQIGGAVLLNAHPSRSGMSQTGDLDGGSTAWSNSARSRWSLVRPKGDDDGQPDTNERILTRRKANYASIGDEIRLRWADGVLVPASQGAGGIMGAIDRQAADNTFITLLERCNAQGLRVSASRNAGNFAPKVFAKRPDDEGYSQNDFDLAMSRLFAERRIELHEYGRKGDARQEIVRVVEPDEEASE
jgi:RecA-family ATPase